MTTLTGITHSRFCLTNLHLWLGLMLKTECHKVICRTWILPPKCQISARKVFPPTTGGIVRQVLVRDVAHGTIGSPHDTTATPISSNFYDPLRQVCLSAYWNQQHPYSPGSSTSTSAAATSSDLTFYPPYSSDSAMPYGLWGSICGTSQHDIINAPPEGDLYAPQESRPESLHAPIWVSTVTDTNHFWSLRCQRPMGRMCNCDVCRQLPFPWDISEHSGPGVGCKSDKARWEGRVYHWDLCRNIL